MHSSRKASAEREPDTLAADIASLKQWVADLSGKAKAAARAATRKAGLLLLGFFSFQSRWDYYFRGFLIVSLQYFRSILTKHLYPGSPVLSKKTVDAFWTMAQIRYGLYQAISWVAPAFQWLFQWVVPFLRFCSPAVTWLAPVFRGIAHVCRWASPYIPFVSLVLSAIIATSDFWYLENKNGAATLKWLAEISGSVLLSVGFGLMASGSAVAMLYTAPLLIGLAAGMVATVGLVKCGYHFYQALNHPDQWKEHAWNGVQEILKTTISVTACVLTFFGISMGQDVSQSLLANGDDLYKSAAVATDVVLAAGGTLVAIDLIPRLYTRCQKLYAKCVGGKAEEPEPVVKKVRATTRHVIAELYLQCENLKNASRSKVRQEKLGLLLMAKNVWEGEMTYQAFDEAVKKVEKTAYKTGVFHSFWKETSETRRLVDETLARHKPAHTENQARGHKP
ncbi:MAG TPA: hypothetical protein VLJ15_08800 [Gammaproteobacteria bacterium]|nr:hypothetical protein [Gammaproteobacteria bacterium]